jgi:Zn ribbon nucleic-acid-binding protein
MASDGMFCPNCGRNGLVRCAHDNDDDVFQCVYCDYRHDLTTGASSGTGMNAIQVVVALFLLILVVLPLAGLL